MTWHTLYDAALAEEPVSRVEWTLTPANDDGTVTRVTLRHLDLARSPGTWANVRLGWVGRARLDEDVARDRRELGDVEHGRPAMRAGRRRVRRVAPRPGRRGQQLDVGAARRSHALAATKPTICSAGRTRRRTTGAVPPAGSPRNAARGSWLVSRAHAVLGHGELALHHADQCAATCAAAGLDDFDLAYAHEARARALACLGRLDEARVERKAAAVPSTSPTPRTGRSSTATSPPNRGSASLSSPSDATPDRVRPWVP